MFRFNRPGLWLALLLALPVSLAGLAQTPRTQTTNAPVAPTVALPAAELKAAEQITAARLSEYLHVVASDAMEGRDTPSRGLDETAKYIADHLKQWGLKPAGDNGTYFQTIALKRTKVDAAKTHAELQERALTFGTDFLVGTMPGAAAGPLVYAGHGWVIKAKNIDAFQGLDVRGKIVVVSAGYPEGVTRADLRGQSGTDWIDPELYAQQHGARGLVVIPRARDLGRWWYARRAALERGQFTVARFEEQADDRPAAPATTQSLPTIYASAQLLDALFAGEPQTGAQVLARAQTGGATVPFALAAQKVLRFDITVATDGQTTQNVVAVLPGRDPVRQNEYVALGAHYDHVGKCTPVNGDSICNGADDDGSGTVAILSMAEAFAHGPRPARSLLFVWHCGEEKGLWGSRYFTRYPTVPLKQIVAQLNIDMIGRSRQPGDTTPANRDLSGPDEIYVIGSRMMSSTLGTLSAGVNHSYLNLAFNYRYDDPTDPNRFFFRSDHFNYAQQGVPIVFYFDGVHEDYHRATDSADKIDYAKMQKVARTIFLTAAQLADAPTRPVVDRQLPAGLTER